MEFLFIRQIFYEEKAHFYKKSLRENFLSGFCCEFNRKFREFAMFARL